ncbi:MAG: serine hydrolase [Clostridia bacterium]|nr:serine hydrolase [Clostridia bacterium]
MTKSDFYVNPRISKKALQEFFDKFQPGKNEIHTFQIYDHDKMVLRIAPAPYRCTDKREIYSLSKSFCSTAIGFLCGEGKISVEDRIVDLFPDKLPETVSENLAKMRLKHVLSMNTGHKSCVMYHMIRSEDAVKAFLAQEVVCEPGTHFAYNTGATCLLSCIVEKFSGMKLLDYLTCKLFLPLGISDVRWNRVPSGQNEGGCGIHVCSDDIIKLGLLYLHGGVWNGKRLLSEAWVKEATSPISDNSCNGTPDWCAGYGYQFWCNYREGFRGDGAFGQLCFVLPERQIVIAVQTELGDMQGEIDALMELVYHLYDEDETAEVVLPVYRPLSSERKTAGFENTFYRLDKNPMGWTGVYFVYDAENGEMKAVFSNGTDQYPLAAGNGHFAESTLWAKKLKPKLVDLMSTPDTERCRIAASYTAEEGKLTFAMRYLNCPHRCTFTFTAEADSLQIRFDPAWELDGDASVLTGHKC